jgi:hypothetical protein
MDQSIGEVNTPVIQSLLNITASWGPSLQNRGLWGPFCNPKHNSKHSKQRKKFWRYESIEITVIL